MQRHTVEFKFNVSLVLGAAHAELIAFWILHYCPNKSRGLVGAKFGRAQTFQTLHYSLAVGPAAVDMYAVLPRGRILHALKPQRRSGIDHDEVPVICGDLAVSCSGPEFSELRWIVTVESDLAD